MAGVILENISTKKLVVICMFLLSLSLFTFIFTGVKGGCFTSLSAQTVQDAGRSISLSTTFFQRKWLIMKCLYQHLATFERLN